ncbi:hypothetical protein [Chromobacterium violaceum]|uniref:hypothetical protein n=1 Tax=Chromobacterium violaceum TaxID=536 RepID=UPI000B026D2D|nr:hypothetical protein [Chromobacterium violaceum]
MSEFEGLPFLRCWANFLIDQFKMLEFKDFVPLGSWALVLMGWCRVTKENNARELRKEIKERIDAIGELVDSVEDDSNEYYVTEPTPDAAKLARKIKSNLASVGHHLNILSTIDREKYNCSQEFILLRQTVTGKQFDSNERSKIEPDDQIFIDISAAAAKLTRKLDRAYAVQK